jgi:hypothetical protein
MTQRMKQEDDGASAFRLRRDIERKNESMADKSTSQSSTYEETFVLVSNSELVVMQYLPKTRRYLVASRHCAQLFKIFD